MNIEYKELKAGDLRKRGDEVKHRERKDAEWHTTQLIGHKILESDLVGSEYRRPLV